MTSKITARIAGYGYLIIFILGLFANFFVIEKLVLTGNSSATVSNILANESLFRTGILSFIIMVIFDVIVAWALYIFFKPLNKNLSLLAAWFRLVNCSIFAIALYNLLSVLHLLSGAEYLAVIEMSVLQTQIMLFINAFNSTWLIGLVFFGIHLFILGYLILSSNTIPKILGILLIAAAIGYLIDSFANFLLPSYLNYKDIFLLIVAIPGIIGELSFSLWLLFKGTKLETIK